MAVKYKEPKLRPMRELFTPPTPQPTIPAPPPADPRLEAVMRLRQQADALEQQLAPPPPRGGVGNMLLRSLGEGVMATAHPQGFAGYQQDQAATERQRQQDLLARAKGLRGEALEQEQLGIQQQNLGLQQRNLQSEDAYRQAQIEKLRTPAVPEPYTLNPGDIRFSGMNQQVAQGAERAQPSPPAPPAGFSLGPGQQRFDASGKLIASVPGEPKATAQAAAGTAQAALGQMSGLAQATLRDPSILRTLTPSDRGRIYEELGRSGQIPPTQFANVVSRTLDSIKALQEDIAGKGAAVGFGFPTIGMTPPAGTAARNYHEGVKQLLANLTLPELELMRGLGHMSDAEFATVTRAATKLSENLSEEAFDAELTRVQGVFMKMAERLRAGTTPASTPSGATPPAAGGWKIISVK